MTIKATLQENKKKLKDLQKQIRESSKQVFNEESKNLFETYPNLLGFRWRQYTPYFNDGDECIFHTQDHYIRLTTTDEEDGDYEDGYDSFYGDGAPAEYKAVTKFLGVFDDDAYRFMFGDHVQITVTRDGIEVEEYGHD